MLRAQAAAGSLGFRLSNPQWTSSSPRRGFQIPGWFGPIAARRPANVAVCRGQTMFRKGLPDSGIWGTLWDTDAEILLFLRRWVSQVRSNPLSPYRD
jgi:hypothetical protein